MLPVKEFFPLLSTPSRVVITTHQKPDGDAMGSSLGLMHFLQKLGHTVTVISPTNWAAFLNWMPGTKSVVDFELKRQLAEGIIREADWIFCLDFNNLPRTKNMEASLLAASGIKILIDHHQEPQSEAFNYGISIPAKSSTCEMVYDFIVESGHKDLVDITIAECLYTGVMTDTGSFRFPVTSSAVHTMIAELKKTGLEHQKVHDHIYDSYLENRLRFTGHVLLNRMNVLYEYNTVLIAIPKNDLLRFNIQTGDTEGLVNYPLSILGIKMVAIVIDRDEERKWSFRSKGNVDVNTFARKFFQGGGHFHASGGKSTESLDEAIRHFHEVIKTMEAELA
ncbi:MAG: bifunctional oligoribonuclease/PAP phosphatase NrnA [Bacteroidota bacterium]